MTRSLIIVVFLLGLHPFLWGFEGYDAIEALLPKDQLPRIMNSLDLTDFQSNNPQPLLSPRGDFNSDGQLDMALAGIYDLPTSSKRYFLLVATKKKRSYEFKKLFFEEYKHPLFLHAPGTTGEGDPGDQAFSMSFCFQCDQGVDFYWKGLSKKIIQTKWKPQKRFVQKTVLVRPDPISEEIIDQALKLVGPLPEVKALVKEVTERQGQLVTRVKQHKNLKKKSWHWVHIIERNNDQEKQHGSILVDIHKKKVLKKKGYFKKRKRIKKKPLSEPPRKN